MLSFTFSPHLVIHCGIKYVNQVAICRVSEDGERGSEQSVGFKMDANFTKENKIYNLTYAE